MASGKYLKNLAAKGCAGVVLFLTGLSLYGQITNLLNGCDYFTALNWWIVYLWFFPFTCLGISLIESKQKRRAYLIKAFYINSLIATVQNILFLLCSINYGDYARMLFVLSETFLMVMAMFLILLLWIYQIDTPDEK